jgi:hypothetical protein
LFDFSKAFIPRRRHFFHLIFFLIYKLQKIIVVTICFATLFFFVYWWHGRCSRILEISYMYASRKICLCQICLLNEAIWSHIRYLWLNLGMFFADLYGFLIGILHLFVGFCGLSFSVFSLLKNIKDQFAQAVYLVLIWVGKSTLQDLLGSFLLSSAWYFWGCLLKSYDGFLFYYEFLSSFCNHIVCFSRKNNNCFEIKFYEQEKFWFFLLCIIFKNVLFFM